MKPAEFAEQFSVSRETLDQLEAYERLLLKWSNAINLVSAGDHEQIWARHFADSAQLLPHFPTTIERWVDLGSGGGFPALVCAIMGQEHRQDVVPTLIESDQRKAAFLRVAARELGVAVDVQNLRCEDYEGPKADFMTARAFARLPKLLDLAEPLLKPDAVVLLLKGKTVEEELTESRMGWHMDATLKPSLTDEGASIVRINAHKRKV